MAIMRNLPTLLCALFLIILLWTCHCLGQGSSDNPPSHGTAKNFSLFLNGDRLGSIVVIPFDPLQDSYLLTRQLTFEAWVKPTRTDPGGAILNKAIGICKDDWILSISSNLTPHFRMANSCGGNERFVEKNRGLRLNAWQHIAGVWDGENISLFINGIRIARTAYNGFPSANEIDMSIGANNHWNDDHTGMRGYIDEVRYSNVARYESDFIPMIRLTNDRNTVFLFHFDEGVGTILHDASSHGLAAMARDVVWSSDTPEIQIAEYQPDSNSVLLLHFDETKTSFVRDATSRIIGSAKGTGIAQGRFGKARTFANDRDRIDVMKGSRAHQIRDGLSVECWIKIGSYPSAGRLAILAQNVSTLQHEPVWCLNLLSSGKLTFRLKDGTTSKYHEVITTVPISKDVWHHIAGVWYGKRRSMILFVDAMVEASINNSAAILADASGVYVAGLADKPSNYSITIDEVRISNKARVPEEFRSVVAPRDIRVMVQGGVVDLAWEKRANYVDPLLFRIYRGPNEKSLRLIGATSATSFTDTVAFRSAEYVYCIKAVDITGFESAPSTLVTVSIMTPDEPKALVLSIIVSLLAACVGVFGYLYVRSRRKPKWRAIKMPLATSSDIRMASSIYVFGDFQVFDKNRKEITNEFSPKLRQLFLMILLNSFQGGDNTVSGISSRKLTTALWPDVDQRTAKNSRGVLIKRLRDLLVQVGDVDVVCKRSQWMIQLESGTYSDWFEFCTLAALIETTGSSTKPEHTSSFINIAKRGPLLRDESFKWLDAMKVSVTDQVVHICLKYLQWMDKQSDAQRALIIADVALLWESLNEEALCYKLKLLARLGRHTAAKTAYDNFAIEYADIIGKPYPRSFGELTS